MLAPVPGVGVVRQAMDAIWGDQVGNGNKYTSTQNTISIRKQSTTVCTAVLSLGVTAASWVFINIIIGKSS